MVHEFHSPRVDTPEGAKAAIDYMVHLRQYRRYAFTDNLLLTRAIDGLVRLHGLTPVPQ